MNEPITRREFLRRAAIGAAMVAFHPADAWRRIDRIMPEQTRARVARAEAEPRLILDDDILTRFFHAGYTQQDLVAAWANGDLVNGFTYGLIDTGTLGGVPVPSNVSIEEDGSARLTLRRPTEEEWSAWNRDPNIRALILKGEENKLEMKLASAAFHGRIPTDVQSIEARITLPQRALTRDPDVGMSGTAWTFWTQPDMERLAAMLRARGASEDEMRDIGKRIGADWFEEDIAEFSLGEARADLGYPLWVRFLGGQVITFLSGRKIATRQFPRVDIMRVLFEPLDVNPSLLFFLQEQTMSGWLAKYGETFTLTQPLHAKLEIGAEVYDATRDAMVVPMTFRLNGVPLEPVAVRHYPGLENDPTGSAPSNLSLWKIRTRDGAWVTIPRAFILNFCSSGKHRVTGTSDYVRVSDLRITRRRSDVQDR
jgi:hypothetical protein